jgi:plasmid stabilization system protein ParE
MQDLFDISLYTLDNWGERQKDKYLKYIQKRLDTIATFPRHGKLIQEYFGFEKRVILLKHHSIIYYLSEDFVYIDSIIHHNLNI